MTPDAAIDMLDRFLAENGEDVTLRRIVGGVSQDCGIRAHVRALKEDEIVSGVSQDDRMLIMSPTEIAGASWPGGSFSLPRRGDKALLQGPQMTTAEFVKPVRMGGQVVRIEMRIRG